MPEIDWIDETSPQNLDHHVSQFMECVRDCFLFQYVKQPTHDSVNQAQNILHLVFIKEEGMISEIDCGVKLGNSDHKVMKFDFNCYSKPNKNKPRKFKYDEGNYEQLNAELGKYDWKSDGLPIEDRWRILESRIMQAVINHIPRTSSAPHVTKHFKPLWLDDAALIKVKKKLASFKRCMDTREGQNYNKYAKARNQAKWACRIAIQNYEKVIARNSKLNPKVFF